MEAELAAALVEFRQKVKSIGFDAVNPHFKNKYASLAAIHKIVDPLLAECGLTIMQAPANPENGPGVGVVTTIIHKSGATAESTFYLPTMKNDPQSAGSSVTYARRYAISGILGLVTEEDDDNESAYNRRAALSSPNQQKSSREKSRKVPAMSAENRSSLKEAADKRIKSVGTPDDTQSEVLAFAAKALGKSSPIELVDSEFEQAMKFVKAWMPEGGVDEG